MVSPANLDFSQPGPAPGSAAGWVVDVHSAGPVAADYRGTDPAPSAYEGFDRDWDGDQAYALTIPVPQVALYDRPQRPLGAPFEGFTLGWDTDSYLLVVDPGVEAEYSGPGSASLSCEDFAVGWSAPLPVVSSTATDPVTVTLSVPHGVAVGQHFPVYVHGHLADTAADGRWPAATAASPTQFTLPTLGNAVGGATGFATVDAELGVAGAPAYASVAGMYDGGAHAFEDFTPGWGDATYYTTAPAPTAASYRGWAANPTAPPALVAASHAAEDFYQVVPDPVPVALVDTGASLLSLAPGQHLPDGARVRVVASAPFSFSANAYPAPLVPTVGYVVWNAPPDLGMDRVNVGDPSAAVAVAVASSTDANPTVVTTAAPHGLGVGEVAFFSGHTTNAPLNGFLTVSAVLSPTQFTVLLPGGAHAGIGTTYGPSGTAYGPIFPATLTGGGGAQLTLVGDSGWDWPNS